MTRVMVEGLAGQIEVAVDRPAQPRGLALIAHPHPLFGGTFENKIVTTLARCFKALGYITLCPNFRGVGASQGVHDHGIGETEDLLAVARWAQQEFGLPLAVLAGFSFGAFVQTRVAKALGEQGLAPRMVLVGTAAGEVRGARAYSPAPVLEGTLVIHGECDDTVPLANVLDWARPQSLPVVVVPGVDHFFHGKLAVIRQLVMRAFGA